MMEGDKFGENHTDPDFFLGSQGGGHQCPDGLLVRDLLLSWVSDEFDP